MAVPVKAVRDDSGANTEKVKAGPGMVDGMNLKVVLWVNGKISWPSRAPGVICGEGGDQKWKR